MSNRSPEPAADVARLIEIMRALRTPVTGCPWDLEQGFASIAPYTIEEAYEVADAIQRGDLADLKDELGDLLLQVVYHATLAEEQHAFDFGDVVLAITTKMIRRHPHVFGDAAARTAGAAKGFWDRIKAEEKAAKAAERSRHSAPGGRLPAGESPGANKDSPPGGRLPAGESPGATRGSPDAGHASLLADVTVALPALTRAVKLQAKAAEVGFDWPSLAPVLAKMREELAEFEAVVLPADPRGVGGTEPSAEQRARIADELGDVLFVAANVARHLAIDPEAALRGANAKFTRRFAHIEAALAAQGKAPGDSDLAEMDALWDAAKRAERAHASRAD